MKPHPPADWFEFWVRFVCGALFGGIVGLGILLDADAPLHHAWMVPAICSVISGVLA